MKLTGKRSVRIGVVLAILMLASWAKAGAADCYVLAAGVDNYPGNNKLHGDLNDVHNTVRAFAAQKGKMFNRVFAAALLDGKATSANIMNQFKNFARLGKAGDTFVVFFSGHGGRWANHQWFLVPYDSKPVTSKQLLDASDVLIQQGKNVMIIIDACFSGQLRLDAASYISRYRHANHGGLVLMLSSSAEQTSNALGNYSAFAKAFADGMAGAADLNHDGKITLQELRTYTNRRTAELLRQNHNSGRQDSVVAWSPSLSGGSIIAGR